MNHLKPKPFVLSPNDIARVEKCEAARVLVAAIKDQPSFAQWHGIAVHRFLEYCVTRGRGAALAYVKKKFKRQYSFCEKLDVSQLPDNAIIEPQFIIDTARRVGTQVHDYHDADPAEHIYMRGDLMWTDDVGEHVADFKSGDPAKHLITLPAKSNVQLLTLAAARWLDLDRRVDEIHTAIVSIFKSQFHWNVNTAVFSADELDQHVTRLRKAHLTVLEDREDFSGDPKFTPGPHCFGCRARPACPEAPPEEKR